MDKWTRGHTTPKRILLLLPNFAASRFAFRLHFRWYLRIYKTQGEQRFRCVSERVNHHGFSSFTTWTVKSGTKIHDMGQVQSFCGILTHILKIPTSPSLFLFLFINSFFQLARILFFNTLLHFGNVSKRVNLGLTKFSLIAVLKKNIFLNMWFWRQAILKWRKYFRFTLIAKKRFYQRDILFPSNWHLQYIFNVKTQRNHFCWNEANYWKKAICFNFLLTIIHSIQLYTQKWIKEWLISSNLIQFNSLPMTFAYFWYWLKWLSYLLGYSSEILFSLR